MRAQFDIPGIILAGGKSRRFEGGDKEDALLDGKTLLEHVIERARPQVADLAISRAQAASSAHDLETVHDKFPDAGPLGGLHAGLVWASAGRRAAFLATFACDTPLIPRDLVERLSAAIQESNAPAAVAACDGETHPTLGLWSTALATPAFDSLTGGRFSLMSFAHKVGACVVDFPATDRASFFNVNTIADLAALQGLKASNPAGRSVDPRGERR